MVDSLAVEQPVDYVERLLHAPHLLAGIGPVHPRGGLVEGLPRADPEEAAAREQLLERGAELGDHRRVVAVDRGCDAGADCDRVGCLPDRAQQGPRLARVTRLPQGWKWSLTLSPSKPACSASTACSTSSLGGNCSVAS